jgi:glycerophosphoryl diester phosphodiesterase
MKIIAHRGNLEGPNPTTENTLQQIYQCIEKKFDVEIDLRLIEGKLMLGHDEPQYEINLKDLYELSDHLWIHCKNVEALNFLSDKSFHYFWHETDQYTLTNRGIGWVYPGIQPYKKSVVVMPELHPEKSEYIRNVYGICTDFPFLYKI